MEYLSIPQYAKKHNMPQNTVRAMIKATPPQLDFIMVGVKVYIKDDDNAGVKALENEMLDLKILLRAVAEHLGVKNIDEILNVER